MSSDTGTIDKSDLLFKVDGIETRFLYLWKTCSAKVRSTKSLAVLTVLISAALLVIGLMGIYGDIQIDRALELAYLRDLYFLLFPGFVVASFLYVSACVFVGVLNRRRMAWNYAGARFKEELFSTTPQ